MMPTTPLSRCLPVQLALGGCALTAMLVGCVDTNDRISIGNEYVAEGFTPPPMIEVDAGPIPARPDDGPSLVGLDRRNWGTLDYPVPYDGTRHRPHYRDELRFTDVTARQRNQYPTLSSSLDLNGDEFGDTAWWQRLGEVGLMPFFAAGEAVLILPKLIGEPQTLEEWSPSDPYELAPWWGPMAHFRVSEVPSLDANTGSTPAPR